MLETVKQALTSPKFVLIVVMLIIAFGKFGFGLGYISVTTIIKNHLSCFRNPKGGWVVIPILNYFILPFIMGYGTALVKKIDDGTVNIITIIISVLTGMLFSLLTMVIDMKSKINQNDKYYSTEAKISKASLIETYYAVVFELLVSILLLILCFLNCFTKIFGMFQSFLIYSLTYLLLINLLMIIKRIFKVIDADMEK